MNCAIMSISNETMNVLIFKYCEAVTYKHILWYSAHIIAKPKWGHELQDAVIFLLQLKKFIHTENCSSAN